MRRIGEARTAAAGALNEFREFIARGNAMDLAVGIIIGAAFTGIVNSLVQDLINPLIGLFTGGVDFSNLFVALSTQPYPSVAAAEQAGVAVFRYGSFITAVINFLIIAWVVFILVKAINRLKVATLGTEPPTAGGPTQEELLTEIRDLVKAGRAPAASPPPDGPAA